VDPTWTKPYIIPTNIFNSKPEALFKTIYAPFDDFSIISKYYYCTTYMDRHLRHAYQPR
jgi:hypothetical protein